MKPDIVLVEDISTALPIMELLEPHYTVHVVAEGGPNEVPAAIAGRVRALVTTTNKGADSALIGALPRLEMIANAGAHLDRIDLAAARARGIRVTYTPGISTAEVADLAFALLLGAARLTCEGDRYVRAGRWHDGPMRFGIRVNRKRLGIVGLGRIGRVVAKRAGGFAMEVHYHEPRRMTDVKYRYHAKLVELARFVDFLVVTCATSPETDGLIDGPVLKALGGKGVLVNVARGAVHEADLIHALEDGVIAGAGLDTFAHEPQVPDALAAMENVVLQAHMGTKTWETKREFAARTAANLAAHFAGAPVPDPVP
jgi:lactate dehydrogenase-like 2-hydroxyacid dehydrogenase